MTYVLEHVDGSLRITAPYRPADIEIVIWGLVTLMLPTPIIGLILLSTGRLLTESAQPGLEFCVGGCYVLWLLVGGILLGIQLLWYLTGQEVVEVNEAGIVVRHQLGRLRTSRTCQAETIQALSLSQPRSILSDRFLYSWPIYDYTFWGHGHGKIRIKTGRGLLIFGLAYAVRFGSGLTWEEAEAALEEIRMRFPRYGQPATL